MFKPKSHPQIVADMAAKVSSESPINDFTRGSVIRTLVEAAAQEDFQQYVQMLQVIRNYNLDTTEGEDLDNRAAEVGLTRKDPKAHSGFVTIGDARFTKIASKLYAGLAGPTAGSTVLRLDSATTFDASGSVYVGRNTSNVEGPITYSTPPVDQTSYWEVTLDTALVNDHGTDEEVVLAQFGNRQVNAGSEVKVPENDFSEEILFETNQTIILLDGEDSIENVLVTALNPGGTRVPANSIVQFVSSPYTGASVENSLPFVNGSDEETDQELRDRIRDTIQSLSRGTKQSIETEIAGILDEASNSTVVSSSIIPPVILADGPTRVYIDNGRGLEPELSTTGLESLLTIATGGETFLQLENFPIIKANLISQNSEPFNLVGLETLVIKVGTDEETFSFLETDFETSEAATSVEVAEAINNRANLVEARTITEAGSSRIIIWPKAEQNENLSIDSASTALTALNFSTEEVLTLKLYKNDKLLTKDGLTASLLSSSQPYDLSVSLKTTTDSDLTVTSQSRIITKAVAGADAFKNTIKPGDYVRFTSDSDLFYTKVRTVPSDTKIILETAYPINGGGSGDIVIWNSPKIEIAANGDTEETEVVVFGPNDMINPAQALVDELLVVMQAQVNSSKVETAINGTKIKIISEVENSSKSKMQIIGGGAALSLGFCTTAPITGTVDFLGGESVVVGSGTAFLSELQEGQWIKSNTNGIGAWSKIETIEDDSTLYLKDVYNGQTEASASAQFMNTSELSEGQDRDYTLNRSNGQIEFSEPLTALDSITAGSINTRAFEDSVDELFDFSTLGVSSTLIVSVDGGFVGSVTSASALNQFISSELAGYDANLFQGFFIKWTSGNNIDETSFVSSYDNSTGELVTTSNFTNTIIATDKFVLCQVVDFTHSSDFADDENVTALEVVTAISSQLLGGRAEVKDSTKVRVRTSNFGEEGKIQILGGSANSLLSLATDEVSNQETNIAFNTSDNSDRSGMVNVPGFTLSPTQNLAIILDGDATSKTFSITTRVSGEVSSITGSNPVDSVLGNKYKDVDYFKDFWVFWESGVNEGALQYVSAYSGVTGILTLVDVYPSTGTSTASAGDVFHLVPRTAENVVTLFNDLNTTTLSILGDTEATEITGDFVQIATKTAGTDGKVFITGGTANSLGTLVQSIIPGSPTNDITVNSIAGLAKGLPIYLTVDAEVTTGDIVAPHDTIICEELISALSGYYTGMELEILDGLSQGHKTTAATYNNTTGEITLTDAAANPIQSGNNIRIKLQVFVSDLQNTSAPYDVSVEDLAGADIDVSGFIPQLGAAIRDFNGLNFSSTQLEGIDGYKFFEGLVQKTQWTIDGLDRDSTNYPGIGAAGTQFEVLPPVLSKPSITLDITTEQGVSLSSVSGDVVNAVLEYVNSREVGEDVILSEIISSAQTVIGVFDVKVTSHDSNLVIADNELVRLESAKLILG